MALILLPETVPTQAPNGCPLGKLRVIVTLPERLVKSFYPTIQTSHAERAAATGQRSPAGPRRLRDSDTHKRIAVPKAFCVLREHPRPRPKSGKVCRSTPWPRRGSETCGTLRG